MYAALTRFGRKGLDLTGAQKRTPERSFIFWKPTLRSLMEEGHYELIREGFPKDTRGYLYAFLVFLRWKRSANENRSAQKPVGPLG